MWPPLRARFRVSFSVNSAISFSPTKSLQGSSSRVSQGPSMKLLAQMREQFQGLHQIGIVRFPFDDGFQAPLNFKHVAAECMFQV